MLAPSGGALITVGDPFQGQLPPLVDWAESMVMVLSTGAECVCAIVCRVFPRVKQGVEPGRILAPCPILSAFYKLCECSAVPVIGLHSPGLDAGSKGGVT